MPVRELTERPTIPRLGKIRLGDNSGTNNAPKNREYFVVPPEVAEVYGEKPTELDIVFLSDDTELIASQYYRAYNASNGLICKGDGYTADASLDADILKRNGGDLTQPLPMETWAHGKREGQNPMAATKNVTRANIGCPGSGYDGAPPCPMYVLKKCAVRTFLQFAIKDVPGLGVYQMDTGSAVSTRRINGALQMAKQVLGGIAGVPMKLQRVQQEVSPDGMKKKVWMVNLEIDTRYSLTKLLELRAGPVANALLPPVDESEVYEAVEDEPLSLPEVIQPVPERVAEKQSDHLITEEQIVKLDALAKMVSPEGQADARRRFPQAFDITAEMSALAADGLIIALERYLGRTPSAQASLTPAD